MQLGLDPWRPQAQFPTLVWVWDLHEALLGVAEPSLGVPLQKCPRQQEGGSGMGSSSGSVDSYREQKDGEQPHS